MTSAPTPDARFARTAFNLLIGSMAFPVVIAIAIAVAWSPGDLLAGLSGGTLWILIAAFGYAVSLVTLHKLGNFGHHRRIPLWIVSLIATFAIIAAFVASLGLFFGGVLATLEVVSAIFQLRGVLLVLIPDEQSPSYRAYLYVDHSDDPYADADAIERWAKKWGASVARVDAKEYGYFVDAPVLALKELPRQLFSQGSGTTYPIGPDGIEHVAWCEHPDDGKPSPWERRQPQT